jgi:histidine ammonia-lyase
VQERNFVTIIGREKEQAFILNGKSLSINDAVILGRPDSTIKLDKSALENVAKGRSVVDRIISSGQVAYGINTGFGINSDKSILQKDLETLQLNLIRSHAAGSGKDLPLEIARTMTALRINTLMRGHSGIRPETINRMTEIFNKGIIPQIPELGSVGASGDLAPLSHIALGFFLGEGNLWNPTSKSYEPAKVVLENHGFSVPYKLGAKEGLALINGTQYITAVGAHAIVKTEKALAASNVIMALSLVAIEGHREAFSSFVSKVRPQRGQEDVAHIIHELTEPGIKETKKDPQDPYSFRCVPQVHGLAKHTLGQVKEVVETEINSSTDNPLINYETGQVISAGNFHGQYPASALDMLSLFATKHLMNIGTQRIEKLNEGYRGLPRFLAEESGLNSGFMAFEIAAKSLNIPVHAESTETRSTGCGKEDHVSMGPHAARQALRFVDENLNEILTIELMCAVQAIRIRQKRGEDITIPPALKPVFDKVNEVFPHVVEDRFLGEDRNRVRKLVQDGSLFLTAQERAQRIGVYTNRENEMKAQRNNSIAKL